MACNSNKETDLNKLKTKSDVENTEDKIVRPKGISKDCKRWFDGCNICSSNSSSAIATCTERHCFQMEKPKCLDEEK